MPNKKQVLEVWDTCCMIGVLNGEPDKLPGLLSATHRFEGGGVLLGIPTGVVSETVTLSNGSSATQKVSSFLDNAYVVLLQPTKDVAIKSSQLQYRFDTKRLPDLKARAIAAGVPKDQCNRLSSRDSEILATALVYGGEKLTTYDPFLIFLGKEFITPETGLVIGPPDTTLLPFTEDKAASANS